MITMKTNLTNTTQASTGAKESYPLRKALIWDMTRNWVINQKLSRQALVSAPDDWVNKVNGNEGE